MGIRGAIAVTIAIAALGGCSAAGATTAKDAPKAPAPVTAAQRFTVETAQQFAAITGGAPVKVESRWACDQPMRISIAAAPGWSDEQVYDDLLYAVTYLQALGYNVQVVGPSAYTANMVDAPTDPGTVVVAVAPNKSGQVNLAEAVAFTTINDGPKNTSALIVLDASRDGLLPDVILHEFGHILGLSHREVGSVMSAGWANSGHFDADETATVSCN